MELEQLHERFCVEGSNLRQSVLYVILYMKCGSFEIGRIMGKCAHAKDYCALLLGNDIPLGVGSCLLFPIGSFHNLI